MNGILNIDKPPGWTSHDVVAWLRRLLAVKRVGHAGTLDPLATGVLLVCIGQATRVAEYLMASPKTYRAQAHLGVITDTYDVDGRTLSQHPAPDLTEADIADALAPFLGAISQTPPAYSAIKRDGMPAHRRARRGEAVVLEPRTVHIHSIELLAWQTPLLTLEISCAAGVYIRSLVHDLGQALGCGASVSALVRTRSGSFALADALSVDALAEAVKRCVLDRHVHPLSAALENLIPVPVAPDEVQMLRHGRPIPCLHPPDSPDGYAVGADGEVKAIVVYDAERGAWRPTKVLAREN